uniref:Uncharacterized protein n=1 Tax=Amphora coffeiformis TaxID=265554 RepID=A0A7S3L6C3_9STRA|mmetsp:Transcript_3421/g.6548  ORF Transcript_3421/g.6548 Transcript_3421/m.6548 type:complete len:257 (-) Transcript_3421:58-828(-)|eukprot:scaffold2671_cov167-Amphora_coffeaeformis.AAC.14
MKLCIIVASISVLNGYSVLPTKTLLYQSSPRVSSHLHPTVLKSNRWNQEIDENSRRKAAGGAGETVAGAVLGGLLGGPFGALFGASVGSSFGSKNAVDRARQEEMKRLGLSQDMLDSAEEVGLALEKCMQGLKQVQESLETQQRLARRLDADAEELYEKAKAAMTDSKEEDARKYLMERERVRDRLKEVLSNCVTAKAQVAKMETNAAELDRRAMEIEILLQRTIGASAMRNTEDLGLSLNDSDPLLRKFKDMGID